MEYEVRSLISDSMTATRTLSLLHNESNEMSHFGCLLLLYMKILQMPYALASSYLMHN